METCFDRALAVNRPVIFGRRMMPFTLGHARLLFAMRSPVVDASDEPTTFWHVIAAAYLCSMPWRKAESIAGDVERVKRECSRWGRKVPVASHDAGMADMLAYIRQSTEYPPAHKTPDEKPHDPGIPWPWLVAWTIKGKVADPWGIPCVEAIAWYCCECAKSGRQFLTEKQVADADGVVVVKTEGGDNGTTD